MANEFKIKKGLIVTGASGGTVVDIQGSQGQLFSVTDDLSGSIFAVSDISGVPILDINSSGVSTFDGNLDINGSALTITNLSTPMIKLVDTTNNLQARFRVANSYAYLSVDNPEAVGGSRIVFQVDGSEAAHFDSLLNATFAGNIVMANAKILYTDDIRASTGPMAVGPTGEAALTLRTFSTTRLTIASDGDATFTEQAFSSATSSGDASSTLTTKGYVDSLITGATIYRGAWDPSGGGYGSPDLSGVTQTSGYYYICSAAGTAEPNGTGCEPDSWETGDWVIWNDDIVDCAGTGTGGWQKIDNSSVLSGIGTGQTVALWEGAGSVTDSENLGNSLITQSGDVITIGSSSVSQLALNSIANNDSVMYFKQVGTNKAKIGYDHSEDALAFIHGSGAFTTAGMVLDGTGVGIGTTSPASKLDVQGGMSQFSTTLTNNEDWENSPISINERGQVGSAQSADKYAPNLNFHWAGRASKSLWLSAGGQLNFGEYSAAGIPTNPADGQINSGIFYGDHKGTINTATTGTTQTAGNNSTLIATTAYADAAAGAVPIGNYLPLAGGTLTGALAGTSAIFTGLVTTKIYKVTSASISNSYVRIAEIDETANQLSSSVRVTMTAHGGSHVTTCNAIISVGHSQDILIQSNSLAYTQVTLKVESNNNGQWTLSVKSNSPNASTYEFDIQGLSHNLTITPLPTASQTGTTLEHTTNFGTNVTGVSSNTPSSAGLKNIFGGKVSLTNVDANTTSVTALVLDGDEVEKRTLGTGAFGPTPVGAYLPVANPTFTGALTGPYADLEYIKLTAANPGILMKETDTTDKNWDIQVNGGRLKFYEVNDARSVFNEHLTLASGGNLGVGFTSPEAAPLASTKLSVNGNTYVAGTLGIGATSPVSGLQISTNTTGDANRNTTTAGITLTRYISGTDYRGSSIFHAYQGISGSDKELLAFAVGPGNSNSPFDFAKTKMVITEAGNVGIGTTTPNAKLDVQGTQGQLFSVTDDLSGSIFAVADISGVPIFDVNSSGVSYFDGNVGIGDSTPATNLSVVGSIGTDDIFMTSTAASSAGTAFVVNEATQLVTRTAAQVLSDIGAAPATSGGYLPLSGGTMTGNLNINTSTNFPLLFTGTNSTYTAIGIRNTGSGDAGIYMDGINGDFSGSDYAFIGQKDEGYLLYNIGVSSPLPYHVFTGGNVGIGVTGPTNPLHVHTDTDNAYAIRIEGSTNNVAGAWTGLGIGGETNNTKSAILFEDTVGSYSRGKLHLCVNNGANQDSATPTDAALTIIPGGNVGIGTTSPDAKLDIEGDFEAGYALKFTNTKGTGTVSGFRSHGVNGEDLSLYNGANRIQRWDENGNSIFDGNVGIGTDSPDDMLEIYGSSPNIRVTNTAETDAGIVFNDAQAGTGQMAAIKFNSSDEKLKFFVNDETAQRMVIDTAGNVGIGVTAPVVKLHVNQGTVSGTVIKASGVQAQIEIQTSTAGDAHLYMRPNSTGNNAAIFKMTAGTNYNWRWQDDATTPVVFMQLSQSNSSLSVKGDIIAYGSPSDERYKENIKPIESALDKVTKLQGVTFDWKESDNLLDIKEDIGFIAQDVQKIVPELVRENKDGKLSLRYQGITPILLEAIKELKAEIDLLKSKPCNCNNCNCNI